MASPDYDLSADRSSPVMLCPYLLYNSEAGGPGHLCKSEIQNSMGEIVDKTLLKTYNLSVNLVGAYLNSTLNPEAFKPRDCFFHVKRSCYTCGYVQQPLLESFSLSVYPAHHILFFPQSHA